MNRKEQLSVWAPKAQQVTLVIADRRFPMRRDDGDWWRPGEELTDDLVDSDVDYGFLVDDSDKPLPDPRSRRQPNGVHELSRTYEPSSYAWGDQAWTGRQLAGGVIYEMHVGTFSPDGTLLSAIDRLDHLVELGIDFVEVMPVNGFNGTHNWGYDGVLWYTVQEQYGGPVAYQQFVDACHQRGLAVIQDVVYNHLGPSGNYLAQFGPYLKEGRGNTWGDSVNLDTENSDEVRRYIIENALMWLRDYHVDGLRLDAVHALVDTRATHLLEQMAVEVDALSAFVRRPVSLIAESDMNAPRLITPREAGGYGLAGQWSDDFHHALYVSLTGDTTGYYGDFGSLETLAKVFRAGFFHNGTMSTFRGRHHGAQIDTQRMPTWRLVVFSDNHDQIGNRAAGNRLSSWLNADQLRLAALVTLLSPFTPMIFMGEEWGASTPWQFFTSHPEPELGEIVAKGRVEEFAQMDWDISTVPNPQDPSTFTNSKLNWDEVSGGSHAELLDFYRRVIEVRRTYLDLTDPRFDRSAASCSDEDGWLMVQRGEIVMVVNFSDSATEVPLPGPASTVLEVGSADISGDTAKLGAHSAVVASIR